MESFMESLNRLRAVHEKEVLSLQNKLLELNTERCRDAQRVEELCAKNRQLREQQAALKETVRVLENRLRAGLCDRCSVTQELAGRKQQELEGALLQSLRRVFVLTNEVNRLQEENEALREEVSRPRRPGPKPLHREGALDPTSPARCTSPGARKATAEQLPEAHEEAEDQPPEKLGYQMSPVAKISPSANLPEPRAPDVSPQRISNQLHGTIAVVRPGTRACATDRDLASRTPPAQSSTPSPPSEHSTPLDSFLRVARPSAITHESLRRSLQADHLCLLSHHLSLHLRSPHSSPWDPTTAPGGPLPQGLKAREAEAWEEPAGRPGMPGTLVDMQDPRLEGALGLLLAQQLWAQGQADGARMRGPQRLGETQCSLSVGSDSEGPEGEVARAALPGKRQRRPTGPGSPQAKEARTMEDPVPDKPLDLSEWGRGRDAPKSLGQPRSLSPQTAHTPSPEPPQAVEPPTQPEPCGCSNGTQGTRAPELEEPPTPEDPAHPFPGPQLSLGSPGRAGEESRERPQLCPQPLQPDAEGHPELSKAAALAAGEPDGTEEPDATDNEVGLSPGGPSCLCSTGEPRQGPQLKRKRAAPSDLWNKGSKKPS